METKNEIELEKDNNIEEQSFVPSTFEIIKREFLKDKLALFSLTLLVSLIVIIFFSASFLLLPTPTP